MSEEFRNLRVLLAFPVLLYRQTGESLWYRGEIIDVSSADLQFFCAKPLASGTEVDVILLAYAGVAQETTLKVTYQGKVIRTGLASWPDLRSSVAIRISHCRVVPDHGCQPCHSSLQAEREVVNG